MKGASTNAIRDEINWYIRVVVRLVGSVVIAGVTFGSSIALRHFVGPQLGEDSGISALFKHSSEVLLVGTALIFLVSGLLVTVIDVVRTAFYLAGRRK